MKLYVVYVDEVDIVDAEALHAFVYAFSGAFARVVPCVDTVFAVSSYFGA